MEFIQTSKKAINKVYFKKETFFKEGDRLNTHKAFTVTISDKIADFPGFLRKIKNRIQAENDYVKGIYEIWDKAGR